MKSHHAVNIAFAALQHPGFPQSGLYPAHRLR